MKEAEEDDDFRENDTFTKTVTIHYNGASVNVRNEVEGVTVDTDGAHVVVNSTVKEVEYVLSGSTKNGSFKMYSSNKFKLTLGGVTITNPIGAAINIQSKKRLFVVLADGTENNLADGTNYTIVDGEDMKGCFFSEAQLIFSGQGTLNIAGNYRHALCSDDYIRFRKGVKLNIRQAAKDGIHTNDGIIIGGGIHNKISRYIINYLVYRNNLPGQLLNTTYKNTFCNTLNKKNAIFSLIFLLYYSLFFSRLYI